MSHCRAGGPWLVTDMRRGETIFELDPHLQVGAKIHRGGCEKQISHTCQALVNPMFQSAQGWLEWCQQSLHTCIVCCQDCI